MAQPIQLQRLLKGIDWSAPGSRVSPDLPIQGLEFDSRLVTPGSLFFAFQGKRADGRTFTADALAKGAVAVVAGTPPPEGFAGPWIVVPHLRRALAVAAKEFYGRLDEKLRLTGVTGTNGKTTTCYLIDSILRRAGMRTGLVGTIQYRVGDEILDAVNTTPESLEFHRLLARVESIGGTHVTAEVSSHALELGRVYGMYFDVGVFMNLTRDHLDFHGDMESYFAAKRRLFEGAGAPPPRVMVLNADDAYARRIAPAAGSSTVWYGLGKEAAVRAVEVTPSLQGLRFEIEREGRRTPVESPMAGRVNVYNLLAAYATGLALGVSHEMAIAGIADCGAVPGRFERVDEGQPFGVFVDYAHTDDALRNVLATARELTHGRVITVFGCGGDRDREKRPLMGQAAGQGSDFVVLSSDNPRSEDPLAIINDALVGLRRTDVRHVVEPDRATAIRKAIEEASAGDVVVLAGKGHETYQVLKDRTIEFDDRQVARRVLRGFGYARERG
ncbi:MAG: UDP-N-acetylmuramoyl-L-alanyl-D-glutamate--2,6-diaminopimelate ligase [Bryobacteraceae bacterium]